MSWITTFYFCRVASTAGGMLLGSSGGGFRGPTSDPAWWPQTLGPEVENLGNIMILRNIPATIELGVRIIAYGTGLETLKIRIFRDEAADEILFEYKNKIKFILLKPEQLPGVASITTPITNLRVAQPGLYWFSALTGRSHITRLPLYIARFSDVT